MRPRPLAWLLLSALCFAGAYYFWRLGERWAANRAAPSSTQPASPVTHHASRATAPSPFQFLSQAGALNSPPATEPVTNNVTRDTNRFAFRLSNTSAPLRQLQGSDQAILLENALLDTSRATPSIPDHLRAHGDPGAYVVQSRGPIDKAFRSVLQTAGAVIVSYIPNNAFLVRAPAAVAQQLEAAPRVQAVLPYEPYYKLKLSLLKLAVAQDLLPARSTLNVLLFGDAREATRAALQKLGARIVGDEELSPFGPVLKVIPPEDGLPAVAGLPGVQEVEWALPRASANDLSRARIGVSTDPVTTNSYLGLTGSNVLVNINDSGVDGTHPDLSPRVFAASTNTLVDPNGHGTHVAGIIASSGSQSSTVTNAAGPSGPYSGTNTQFRGKAPAANLFALPVGGIFSRPFNDGATLFWPSDGYLQQTAAQTNAFISNNSWNYVGPDSQTYDLHAASYDAAVRDALPLVTGSQPLLMVFSAGNGGGGNGAGGAGFPDTIETPGTAKNVITVGAIEQLRNVTNNAWACTIVSQTNSCSTNQPWLFMTDANDEVASFSSRGPVGRGIEGDTGRFKPDLVAPGTFVISTKSQQWDTNAYYNPTSHIYHIVQDVFITTNALFPDSIFVPSNAVQLNLTLLPNTNSPVPFPDLPIYINPTRYPTNTDPVIGTNHVSLPPDLPLSAVDQYWFYGIGNRTAHTVVCDLLTDIVVINNPDNRLQVLAGMNDGLGPYYRYESGTSMAAADVSGTLALMQEFFEQRLSRTNSPALMKALLINGARSVGSLYDFNVTADVNFQGWGLVNLPTTIPGSLTNRNTVTNAMVMVDQSPANALATAQSRTYKVSLSPSAQRQPMRITLVWTDPPGNPIASVKLVNDLDLVVTNLDNTNFVYFGNDIISGSDFNQAWRTNNPPNIDTVNNVENVYLTPDKGINSKLSTNYSITVVGHRVNVNAVTAQTNNVCQDYALVISGGDGLVTNAIGFDTSAAIVSSTQPLVTVITNSFVNSPDLAGGILFNQRVGANPQLLGTNTLALTGAANGVLTIGVTNQWHFYAITNDTPFTNAAFLTFLPFNLADPRMGVFEPRADRATRPEADIDLYVAPPAPNNFALTNLDPAVVDAATKSLSRGGTETIVYSNATTGVYYIGVKSEDQQAAEYAILAVFSRNPFGNSDTNGAHLIGIPTYATIPDGSPELPGVANVIAVNVSGMMVRRVIVTNVLNHELIGDLIGGLSHGSDFSILNNHTRLCGATVCETWTSFIYDDSNERNVGPDFSLINPYVQHTDGPGSLGIFAGKSGEGQWMLSMVDNATNHLGTNVSLGIFLERQPDLTGQGITVVIQGNACRDDFIEVPANAVSLSVTVAVVSATGPTIDYTIEVCPPTGGTCKSTEVTNALGGSVTIDQTDLPPLQAGTYRIRVCNLTADPITVNIRASFAFSLTTFRPVLSTNTIAPVPIRDDAVTDVFLMNNSRGIISSVDVGLLIRDPRISDLAITLISPKGTRILLFENRGAASTNGLGTFDLGTNLLTEPFFTNNFDFAPVGLYAPGSVFQGWGVLSNFVEVLDDYTCLCLSNHVLALFDGAVSNSLPTTNSLPATNAIPYVLTYNVNHLPWLEGMVTWWPLDFDGSDIFGGFDGLLLGDVSFSTGKVYQAYIGDGVATRMVVPRCPELDLGRGRGFSIEGWINPGNFGPVGTVADPSVLAGPIVNPANGHGYYLLALMYWPDAEAKAIALGGHLVTINDAAENAWVFSTFGNYGGVSRTLYLGFTDEGHEGQWVWTSGEPVTYVNWDSGEPNNGVGIWPYENRSTMYGPAGRRPGYWNDVVGIDLPGKPVQGRSFAVVEVTPLLPAGPLVEWYDPAPPTNQTPLGVQFWLGLTNGPGALDAIIWDTNSLPHVVGTLPQVITNGAWQHVALTYDTNSNTAVLYTNGQSAATVRFPTNFVPRTSGDVYLGFDPTIMPTPINYPNFRSTAGLNLVGNAAQNGTVLRLTPAVRGQIGNAWAQNKQPCAAGFDTSFRFQITNPGSMPGTPSGGDGIMFTVQNFGPTDPSWHPTTAPATGYVDIFFNTFLNWPGCTDYRVCDVSDNSVGVASNGVYLAQTDLTPLGINLTDGAVHAARISFNGNGLTVRLDGVTVLTNVPVPGLAPAVDPAGYAWVGFSAGTGDAWENQDILSWTFGGPTPGTSFGGGLDEFSLYGRALSPCEVNAIYNAGSRGKYGTNVLVCPVVTEVTLSNTTAGIEVFTFTNGLAWATNGPHWETNTIAFSTSTNPTSIAVRGLNPYSAGDASAPNNLNAMVDDFVLSQMVTQSFAGLLHFTENTNLATIPIKFAPAPYSATNFPPVLIFSNDFRAATAGVYQAGASIQGGTNSLDIGLRNWLVTAGPVTVISNSFLDPVRTNWLAMATGSVQCLLPTSPGHRYQLTYNLRGPCAVGWWDGSVEPLSRRARDLISGNNGAFLHGATNTTAAFPGDTSQAYVGSAGLFFSGLTEPPPGDDPDIWPEDIDDPSSKIELADPPQLQFTNAFTIEGWIQPMPPTNETYCGTEQIFFRGYPEPFDCRGLGDPYWLALEPARDGNLDHRDLHFHIADAHINTLGADVLTTNSPIHLGGGSNSGWWHIAAVFDKPFTNVTLVSSRTNVVTITTNALRLYVNGVLVASNYTTLSPFKDLDPGLSPGVTIGNRSRYDWTQPFSGFMDELTVYARALTEPEIAAIAAARTSGKADLSVPAARALAKLSVALDGVTLDVAYGDNSQWSAHSLEFTALNTNEVLTLQSLLPGTLLEGVTLTELSPELYYLPEVSLAGLEGEDAFGIWTLEIWDSRTGLADTNTQLIEWELNLGFSPSNPPPVITLAHGIPYTNSLSAYGVQYFAVPVPQWALLATNILQFANQARTGNPLPVTVLFNQTNFPTLADFPLVGPLVSAGLTTLATNTSPPLIAGPPYYLALTNPNPVGVTFALGVWFDITTLSNCQIVVSNLVGPAGIPRYFQFDVPADDALLGVPPRAVSVLLPGADCNLKVVLSQHLPLPDLNHYDYVSQQPCTNDQIVMLVTNTTPFPIQTNRWYVGVFNTAASNAFFSVQACYAASYPVIIPLANGVPFTVPSPASGFAAPPGPPQRFFFDFIVTNSVPGVLFELYNLSGDAHLVCQPLVPPTMAPYFNGSFFPGRTPEQIVIRTDPAAPANATVPDLRGHWYLGVYNNEDVNVAYTIRAVLTDTNSLLRSAQPLRVALTTLAPPRGLLVSWNSVVGERYIVQYTPSIAAPVTWTNIGTVTATTTFTTFEVRPAPVGGFYRLVEVFSFQPRLIIRPWPGNLARISWSTVFRDYTLQYTPSLFGPWSNVPFPPATGVFTVGDEFVVFDPIGIGPRYYRLIK